MLDAEKLSTVLSLDEALDRALKEADDTSSKGSDQAAADLLENKAIPAADFALNRAHETIVQSAWGREKKDQLVHLLEDRKAAIPSYRDALRSGDMTLRLSVLQKQIEQEKRAMELTSEVRKP